MTLRSACLVQKEKPDYELVISVQVEAVKSFLECVLICVCCVFVVMIQDFVEMVCISVFWML
jgi:hypothetical protein